MAKQRYQALLAVIGDGLSISQVADKVGVSRQTLHTWLARYEAAGLEGLVDRSHRPVGCPHQMPAVVEAALLELRRRRYGAQRSVRSREHRQHDDGHIGRRSTSRDAALASSFDRR